MPPRRPTTVHWPPRRMTCTPRRASQPRSSKSPASRAARGASARTRSVRMAPCGGERPTGSSSRTRSCSARSPNRRTSAGTRIANSECRAGPVTTTSAAADWPISGASRLRSNASSLTLPHHQPATRTATASTIGRADGCATTATAPMTTMTATTNPGARAAFESAMPAHAATITSVGHERPITVIPRRGAVPAERGRCRG